MIHNGDVAQQIRLLVEGGVGSISVRLRNGTIAFVAPPFVVGDGVLQCWTAETFGKKELRIALAEIVSVAANL